MPAHATVTCHFCPHPVHPGAVGTFERVSGWGEYRADGGMNAVRLVEHHREFAHRTCIDRAKRGLVPGQTELLDQAQDEDVPEWDGTQEGFTPVGCPDCGEVNAAKHMPAHLAEVCPKRDGLEDATGGGRR